MQLNTAKYMHTHTWILTAYQKSFGWSSKRDASSSCHIFQRVFALEEQLTSPQVNESETKPAQITVEAGNAHCCYASIPWASVSHTRLKFLSGETASLNVETSKLGLQCKESKGFETAIFKSSIDFIQLLFTGHSEL